MFHFFTTLIFLIRWIIKVDKKVEYNKYLEMTEVRGTTLLLWFSSFPDDPFSHTLVCLCPVTVKVAGRQRLGIFHALLSITNVYV
jgi:hypothetical protein